MERKLQRCLKQVNRVEKLTEKIKKKEDTKGKGERKAKGQKQHRRFRDRKKKWIASESTVVKQDVKESVRYDVHLNLEKNK